MLLRLAYLGITNAFALLRRLPGRDRDKDIEILSLRHQLAVLQRQLAGQQIRFEPVDRAWLAALLHPLPRPPCGACGCWSGPTRSSSGTGTCSPATTPRCQGLAAAVGLARCAPSGPWFYAWRGRTAAGGTAGCTDELLTLGIKVASSTVWEIMREAGIDPAPDRAATTWTDFLRSQADALLATDFIETVTLTGARMYILTVIEHASRRIRVLGVTAHPTAAWVAQAARNLVMDLDDAGCKAKFLIRDRDGKYPAMFDAILANAGINVVLTGIQVPRMNAIMERRVRTCRRELLDRTLIWNQRHLLHALREYERFYNLHRPHQGIANIRPLNPLPEPITDPDQLARLNIHRHDRLGGVLHEYEHAA